jgi:hypothetical protein
MTQKIGKKEMALICIENIRAFRDEQLLTLEGKEWFRLAVSLLRHKQDFPIEGSFGEILNYLNAYHFAESRRIDGLNFVLYDENPQELWSYGYPRKKVLLCPFQIAVQDYMWGAFKSNYNELGEKCQRIFMEMWPDKYEEMNIKEVRSAAKKYQDKMGYRAIQELFKSFGGQMHLN